MTYGPMMYGMVIGGLLLLFLGGGGVIGGSVSLARKFGISPLIIGLTVLAFGTSAPELMVSADAALASFAGVEYDDAPLIEARGRFVDYRVRYPAAAAAEQFDSVLNTIRARRAEKHYVIGEYYERTEHLSSAVYYYRIVMERWPETVAASKARTRLELLGAPNATPDQADGSISTSPSTTEADG